MFEYDAAFVESGLEINPLQTPQLGPIPAQRPRSFGGLHGVFADSLPDAWGEELVRRRCAREGISFESLTALDRLAIVGERGMGALTYEPEVPDAGDNDVDLDLDVLAREAYEILEGRESDVLPELERLGGTSGGARPKVLVAINAEGHVRAGVDTIPDGYDGWLVKFPSSRDVQDIGPLEAAYAAMARAARINVPDHRLIRAGGKSVGYFASKRFDRAPGGVRHHMISVAGTLDLDWMAPELDYLNLLRLVRRATRSQDDVEEMIRRMVFNVVAHNRDDHAKQHAFVYGVDRQWHLSPAYDLTYSHGPTGQQYLAINGEAGDVGADAVRTVSLTQDVKPRRLTAIVGEVIDAVGRFEEFAGHYDVSKRTSKEVRHALNAGIKRIGPLAS
ncbi:MAG: type II toxin-antitoxin system HipA family toxin [Candidatus Eremiobacteraeota bacterium]|nr:type II toxin-antitoxin system HipA family toxin [Candidatus Eremiobacteraeota bacterium]